MWWSGWWIQGSHLAERCTHFKRANWRPFWRSDLVTSLVPHYGGWSCDPGRVHSLLDLSLIQWTTSKLKSAFFLLLFSISLSFPSYFPLPLNAVLKIDAWKNFGHSSLFFCCLRFQKGKLLVSHFTLPLLSPVSSLVEGPIWEELPQWWRGGGGTFNSEISRQQNDLKKNSSLLLADVQKSCGWNMNLVFAGAVTGQVCF